MKHFSGYGSYMLFLALRTHFHNAKYDFFQMKGKLKNATKEVYQRRNDKIFFERLAKQYDIEELKDFYVANLLNDCQYITDMSDEAAHKTYFDYVSWRQSIAYNFKNELDRVFLKGAKQAFDVIENEYPHIVLLYLQGRVSIHTLVILEDFVKFSDKFSKYLSDDILWGKVRLKMVKYRPFLKYDKTMITRILKEAIDDNTTSRETV